MNLLYVMTDHQRFDSIGRICNGIEVTPFLNKFATSSVFFNRAYNTCPLCVPARTALATGIYPTKNGVVFNDWSGNTATSCITLQEILKNNGYKVGQVGVDHIRSLPRLSSENIDYFVSQNDYTLFAENLGISVKRRMEDSIEVLENVKGQIQKKIYSGTNVSKWNYSLNQFKDKFFLDNSLRFIDSCNKETPFALFTYFWAPHPPLCVPEEYYDLFPYNTIDLPNNIGKPSANEPLSYRQGVPAQLAANISEIEWRHVWSAHYALLRMVDDFFSSLVSKLKEKDLYNDTIIVFTSDHGDHLGQHAMYQKMEMYEEAIHVPLVFHIPGMKEANIDTIVSHLDVLPTLCELMSLPGKSIQSDGKSLVYEIETGCSRKNMEVFSAYSGNPDYGDIRRAIITDQYKLIIDDNYEIALFDFKEDPYEMKNVANETKYAEIKEDLLIKCKNYHLNKKDYFCWEK